MLFPPSQNVYDHAAFEEAGLGPPPGSRIGMEGPPRCVGDARETGQRQGLSQQPPPPPAAAAPDTRRDTPETAPAARLPLLKRGSRGADSPRPLCPRPPTQPFAPPPRLSPSALPLKLALPPADQVARVECGGARPQAIAQRERGGGAAREAKAAARGALGGGGRLISDNLGRSRRGRGGRRRGRRSDGAARSSTRRPALEEATAAPPRLLPPSAQCPWQRWPACYSWRGWAGRGSEGPACGGRPPSWAPRTGA